MGAGAEGEQQGSSTPAAIRNDKEQGKANEGVRPT